MDSNLLKLKRALASNPTPENRKKYTHQALRAKQGDFVVWRGGVNVQPPETEYLEIEQPLFVSKNALDKVPSIRQPFQAVGVADLEDLKNLLPLNPTGIVTLPECRFEVFGGMVDEITRCQQYNSDWPTIPVENEPYNHRYFSQPLYDRNTVASSGTCQLNFFQVPLGGTQVGSIRPKTQIETNMYQGGSLPYPRNFLITGISIVPDVATPYEDAVKFVTHSWVRFFIGVSDYFVAPSIMMMLTSGKRTPLVDFRLANPIKPVFSLPTIIELISQQSFRIEVNLPTPQTFSQAFNVYAILHGCYRYQVH